MSNTSLSKENPKTYTFKSSWGGTVKIKASSQDAAWDELYDMWGTGACTFTLK